MTFTKTIIVALVASLLPACALFVGLRNPLPVRTDQSTYGASNTPYLNISTSSAMTVTTSSSRVLATSTAREYVALVNSGSNPAYLCLNADMACTAAGIYLAPGGGSYEILLSNLYQGSITALSSGGNTTITVNAQQ